MPSLNVSERTMSPFPENAFSEKNSSMNLVHYGIGLINLLEFNSGE